MSAQLEHRNAHGYPLSCCAFHGRTDGCNQGRDCPERGYAPLRNDLPITMEDPQLAWIDYVFAGIAVGFLAVLARFVYVNWPVIGALLHLN